MGRRTPAGVIPVVVAAAAGLLLVAGQVGVTPHLPVGSHILRVHQSLIRPRISHLHPLNRVDDHILLVRPPNLIRPRIRHQVRHQVQRRRVGNPILRLPRHRPRRASLPVATSIAVFHVPQKNKKVEPAIKRRPLLNLVTRRLLLPVRLANRSQLIQILPRFRMSVAM